MHMIKISLVFPALFLTACSTLQYGHQQPITVYTTPSNASCTLKNDLGMTSIEGTPATGYIYPSKEALLLTCQKEGYKTLTASIPAKEKDFTKGVSSSFIMSNRLAETTRYFYPQKVIVTLIKK